MRAYLCVTALTFCLPLLAACAADENNPLKNARVGDYATYKLTITFEGDDTSGQITHTVTARSDKEVVITRSGQIKSQQVPPGKSKRSTY